METLVGGYLFIAISGALYIAIGVFSSTLTKSQLIAGMVSFALLFVIIIVGQVMNLSSDVTLGTSSNSMMSFIEYLHTFRHLDGFTAGILDSRPFMFYIINSCWVLGLAILVVETKA